MFYSVPALTIIVLMFFLVGSTVLYFEFKLKIILITVIFQLLLSSVYSKSKTFQLLISPDKGVDWGYKN